MVPIKNKNGFTLMEILVVIAIIGVLASVVLGNVNTARAKAKEGKVKAELQNIRMAIALLEDDTGKWPNGCNPADVVVGSSNEIEVGNACSGIFTTPQINPSCTCGWTIADATNWNGPYIKSPEDPWGNQYWIDSDYYPRKDCGDPSVSAIIALVSLGPNGKGGPTGTGYDCDDIYLEIK
jgi:prepilin-type N-terminal cleavage/methylation domain-containing protein